MRFSHVALNCRDLQATEDYYSRNFGFRRTRLIELGETRIVFIRNGEVLLELFKAAGDSEDRGADGPAAVGVRHIAFQVDDVDASLASLGADAKVTLGPLDFSDFIPGWKTVWVNDPDGNVVEISQGFKDDQQLSERQPALAGGKA